MKNIKKLLTRTKALVLTLILLAGVVVYPYAEEAAYAATTATISYYSGNPKGTGLGELIAVRSGKNYRTLYDYGSSGSGDGIVDASNATTAGKNAVRSFVESGYKFVSWMQGNTARQEGGSISSSSAANVSARWAGLFLNGASDPMANDKNYTVKDGKNVTTGSVVMTQKNSCSKTTSFNSYHCSKNGQGKYDLIYDNKNITITVTPAKNHEVTSFKVNGTERKANLNNNAYTISTLNANTNITVEFSKTIATINATATTGGSITNSGLRNVTIGGNYTTKITPNTDYYVKAIYLDGDEETNHASEIVNNYFTLTNVTEDHSVRVVFAKYSYTVSASTDGNGSVTPDNTTVDIHSNVTLNIAANTGYKPAGVYLDGDNVTNHINELVTRFKNTTYTLANITSDHTIYVTFEKLPFNVNITSNDIDHTDIDPTSLIVLYDESGSVNISARTGYEIKNITRTDASGTTDITSSLVDGTLTINNVTSDTTINVVVERISLTVTASVNDDAHASVNTTSENVLYGDSVSFELTNLDDDYYISGIRIDEGDVIEYSDSIYTLDNVTTNQTVQFVIEKYLVISTSSDENGSILIDSVDFIKVKNGESVIANITANEGYILANLTDNDAEIVFEPNTSVYELTNITEDHNLAASFIKETFEINTYLSSRSPKDSVIIIPEETTIEYGENANITFITRAGYYIESLEAEDENGLLDLDGIFDGAVLSLKDIKSDINIYLTMAAEDYEVIEGANQEINIAEEEKVIIRFDGDYFLFRKLYINNKEVPEKYYTIHEGSTIVELDTSYFLGQDNGTYEVVGEFDNGNTASTTLTISGINSPNTGIFSSKSSLITTTSFATMIISAFAAIFFKKKKQTRR